MQGTQLAGVVLCLDHSHTNQQLCIAVANLLVNFRHF